MYSEPRTLIGILMLEATFALSHGSADIVSADFPSTNVVSTTQQKGKNIFSRMRMKVTSIRHYY
jgi:hypothetical protein